MVDEMFLATIMQCSKPFGTDIDKVTEVNGLPISCAECKTRNTFYLVLCRLCGKPYFGRTIQFLCKRMSGHWYKIYIFQPGNEVDEPNNDLSQFAFSESILSPWKWRWWQNRFLYSGEEGIKWGQNCVLAKCFQNRMMIPDNSDTKLKKPTEK